MHRLAVSLSAFALIFVMMVNIALFVQNNQLRKQAIAPPTQLQPTQAADVFVMPAHLRAEALGLAQIEALASGLPCVSTELGTGTSFANRHGETGLVVPPGDAAALAAALNTLLADADLRRRFGAAGRQRVAALFTRAHMVDSVEAIYRNVLTAR